MGKELVDLYHNKVKRSWKIAFYSTFIIGLFVHIYKFTNTLLVHDSIYRYYHEQKMAASGRWFLSYACGISSFFDLPWINGLLSILFIALTMVIIVDIFKMKNPIVIILTGGLLVAYPAITETLYFGFTCDGYMLSMLMAAIAVRLTLIDDKKILHTLFAIVLLTLSCGIYQSYISFALVLAICYFITIILDNNHETKDYFRWIAKQAIIYISALALYYIIWQLCLHFSGTNANSYLGISEVGLSLATIVNAFKQTIKSCLYFLFDLQTLKSRYTLYAVLNIIFFLLAFVAIIIGICKKKLYKKPLHIILMLVCFIAIPFAAYMWYFASPGVIYQLRMLESFAVFYIFIVVLFEKYLPHKISNISGLLVLLIVFNFAIQANIGYYFMEKSTQLTEATGIEMVSRIHEMDTEADKIVVVGSNIDKTSRTFKLRKNKLYQLGSAIHPNIMFDNNHVSRYLNESYNLDLRLSSPEEVEQFSKMPEVEEMGCWPASDSIQVIDDTIVIKLS